ncbi:sugar ABC transporter permease [candidate division WOR-3 bacterium]|nr:sugar ABC transporter permease [candidate division WOR-3 bacterium]
MRRKEFLTVFIFLLPALLVITIFRLYPILQAIRMSFYKWGLAGAMQFIGLHNFFRLFIDPKFYQSLGNTFWYVIFTVPLTIVISVGLAHLLNQRIKGQGVYRTLYYLPVVTSIVASSVVWKWIFNPDRGVLNAIIGLGGIEPMQWLNDPRGLFGVLAAPLHLDLSGFIAGPSFALVALIIMSVWHNVGYCIIIALAGLQNVPEQYYEAARIDGASGWSIFRHVTIPVLSPTIFYLLVTQTIIAFNTFTPVYVMTQPPGGPLGTTSLVVFYLYEQSFRLWNLGYANAIAFVLFIVIFSLTQVQKRFIEQRVYYE